MKRYLHVLKVYWRPVIVISLRKLIELFKNETKFEYLVSIVCKVQIYSNADLHIFWVIILQTKDFWKLSFYDYNVSKYLLEMLLTLWFDLFIILSLKSKSINWIADGRPLAHVSYSYIFSFLSFFPFSFLVSCFPPWIMLTNRGLDWDWSGEPAGRWSLEAGAFGRTDGLGSMRAQYLPMYAWSVEG